MKKILICRKTTPKVNKMMPNISCSHKTSILDNSSTKTKFKKNLFSFKFYARWAFQWYQSHFSTMNISVGQNCLNKTKPFEYIVPPPIRGVGTINFTAGFLREIFKLIFCFDFSIISIALSRKIFDIVNLPLGIGLLTVQDLVITVSKVKIAVFELFIHLHFLENLKNHKGIHLMRNRFSGNLALLVSSTL